MPHGSSSPKLSATSAALADGRITAASRARHAPSTFSRMPPTGSTVPRERQLPAHGRVPPHRLSGQRRDQGDGQRHPPPTGRPSTGRPRPGARARPSYRRTWRRRRGVLRASAPTSSSTFADSLVIGPTVLPVTRSVPRPGSHAASTSSTSPPSPVAARPRATPGRRIRDGDLLVAEPLGH